MTLSASNQGYLQFMRDIHAVSQACMTTSYIWGGLTLDIVEGRFLREHHDLDAFTLNLLDVLPDMMALFTEYGYTTEFLDGFDMLTIRKNSLHATFNRLDIAGEMARWHHIGEQGTVYFPARWLDAVARDFYNVSVFTAGLAFAYLLKTDSHLLNPEWTPRRKDSEDIARLEVLLAKDNIDLDAILPQAWSISPYWVQRGYPEYAHPMKGHPFRPSAEERR